MRYMCIHMTDITRYEVCILFIIKAVDRRLDQMMQSITARVLFRPFWVETIFVSDCIKDFTK